MIGESDLPSLLGKRQFLLLQDAGRIERLLTLDFRLLNLAAFLDAPLPHFVRHNLPWAHS
jgi:hypothetical protein